ncbi:MAG TPA: ribonucleoside-diphosphate reductase, adenosylcobalamin-dependent, partial [Actinobacteria bacterium]|nr:ribonucleoside-diphosphate reductase, adenosylcobalamin-dependent [Actinomycetota bacterium]
MGTIDKVVKRDGRVVGFSEKKIETAVLAAADAIGKKDAGLAKDVAALVSLNISRDFPEDLPTVEDVQNYVERALIDARRADISKAYILYRAEHAQLRKTKQLLGVTDDLKLSVNAVEILNRRYLEKDDQGKVVETPKKLFERVATEVASVDRNFGQDSHATEADFFAVMSQGKFLPNSPTLMNAGTDIGQLSACFVLPVEDSIIGIFDSLKDMALIHKSGGGTGFSFSRIRPAGDVVKTTAGVSSGPL